MNSPAAKLLVLTGERFACVKISGRANFTSAIDFRNLISDLRQKDYAYFVLDLSECMLMDSTFLGVLAGFGLKMSGGQAEPERPAIELLNPNSRIVELLENLGVLSLFRVNHGTLNPPKCEEKEATPANPTKEEMKSACREAHETLMAINPNNISKFKEVSQLLAEDLKRPR
jgi:anti-anti-sigma regulatory factor